MKVAFTSFEYPPFVEGGAGAYAFHLTEAMARLGHEVHVIAPLTSTGKQYEVKDGVFVHRINFINKKYLRVPSFWIGLRNSLKTINKKVGPFDIFHGNQGSDFFLSGVKHHVTSVHSLVSTNLEAEKPNLLSRTIERGENNFFFEYAESIVLKKADLLIANSCYTKKAILSKYGFQDSKIRVIYPGVSTKNRSEISSDEKRILKSQFKLENDPIILFVGRLVLRKGLHFLLQAFEVLRQKNTMAKLVVVGDGPERKRYLTLTERMNLGKDVVFTGLVDDATLNRLYYSSDLIAIPSVNEPFGIVALEAMLSKKPIVASNSGALPEIVQNNVNGKLVDPRDSFKFAEAIEFYLKDARLSQKAGELNQKKVLENFTWTKNAEQTIAAYESLLS